MASTWRLDILNMRLYSDRSAQKKCEPALLEAGRELLQRVAFRQSNHRRDHDLADVVKTCLTGPDDAPIAAEIAVRLRRAVAAHETYSFLNTNLLGALFEVQPTAVLDALFAGEEKDYQAAVRVFQCLGNHRGSPADAISCEALIAWCEEDGKRRYPLAASVITFASRPEASGPQVWSEQAKALLASTPDPRSVLTVFTERFRPMSWSGSRAAMIEANARLLDNLESHVPPGVMPFVNEAKIQLAQAVARERQSETEDDRVRDERFE